MLKVYHGTENKKINPLLLKRKIIHIDMDAFFAAVEILDHPEWREKPLIVGGSPENRGVVSTANYIARQYGVRSALPAVVAKRLCPQAILVRPRFSRYLAVSKQVMEILFSFSHQLDTALDEAYLDVTGDYENTRATAIARDIKQTISEQLGLSCSAGVAPNKLLAKIAANLHKPDGLTVIMPAAVSEFMDSLAISKIPGVGQATTKKLADLKVKFCADLKQIDRQTLEQTLGKNGISLLDRVQGLDERMVGKKSARKSYGFEHTYPQDLKTDQQKQAQLKIMEEKAAYLLDRYKIQARTITLKLRYNNFKVITRSISINEPITKPEISGLISELWSKNKAPQTPIRLLGISFHNLMPRQQTQKNLSLPLF